VSDELFREVDEDVRRDRAHQLWNTYGLYVIALVAFVVIATAAIVFWRDYQQGRHEANSQRLDAALQLASGGRQDAAIDALEALASDAGGGIAVLARFREAALAAELGETARAVAIYDAVVADKGVDALYRDLARLFAVLHGLDDEPPASLEARLAPLLDTENPWHYSASELAALVALKAGETERARGLLEDLTEDLEAPQGVRARAAELLAALAVS